jgi:hypothetical protein
MTLQTFSAGAAMCCTEATGHLNPDTHFLTGRFIATLEDYQHNTVSTAGLELNLMDIFKQSNNTLRDAQ